MLCCRVKQYPTLATHKGYDDSLCHGDVTLSFQHRSQSVTSAERRKLLLIKRKAEDAAEQRLVEETQRRQQDVIRTRLKT